jgi:uncharacterized membrane protein
LKVNGKKAKKNIEIDLMIAFFIVIFIIILLYLFTSFMRYKALVEELKALKEAYEIEKQQLAEKEETLQKLQKIIQEYELKEATRTTNDGSKTQDASGM